MVQAVAETTMAAIIPWKRKPQAIPSILVSGHARRAPTRRAKAPMRDPALVGVYALIEGLQAGKDKLDRLRYEAKEAKRAAKAEHRQETKTKLTAFVLFDLMAACLIYAMWAGING